MFLSYPIFILMLLFGSLLAMSSSSWFTIWLGLELNMLAFLPLMSSPNKLCSENMLKYFFIQAVSSMIIISSSIILFILTSNFTIYFHPFKFINSTMMLALFIKLGAAPFHIWFPSISEALTWLNLSILTTWQKIPPLVILTLMKMNLIVVGISLMSVLLGALAGLNQVTLKKILVFSSISHLGWILILVYLNENFMLCYFTIYSFTSLSLVFIWYKMKIFYLNQIFNTNKSNIFLYSYIFMILSLGGLPPFLGFFPKWVAVKYMLTFKMLMYAMFMIFMSVITLYFYLRLSYSFLLLNLLLYKTHLTLNYKFPLFIMVSMTILFLPLMASFM